MDDRLQDRRSKERRNYKLPPDAISFCSYILLSGISEWYGAGANLCTRKVVFAPNFDHAGWTVEELLKNPWSRDTTTSLEPLDLEHGVAAEAGVCLSPPIYVNSM